MAWRVEFDAEEKRKRKALEEQVKEAEHQARLDEIDRQRIEREDHRRETREAQHMRAEDMRCARAWKYQRKCEEEAAEAVRMEKVRLEKERIRRIRFEEKQRWRDAKPIFQAQMEARAETDRDEIEEMFVRAAADMKEHYERKRQDRAMRLKAKRDKEAKLHRRPKYMQLEIDKKERAREAKELAARSAIEHREERERTINAKQKAFKWKEAPSTYEQFYEIQWDWGNADGAGECAPALTDNRRGEKGRLPKADEEGMVDVPTGRDGARQTPYAPQPKGICPAAADVAKEYVEVIVPQRRIEAALEQQRADLLHQMRHRHHKKKKKGPSKKGGGKGPKAPPRAH